MISKVSAFFSLVDAGLVREGVLADDRLVVLHREARDVRHLAADRHDLGGVDAGAVRHDVVAHAHRHHHLFQRGVAGALAQAVDRALDLPGAGLDGGQAVRRRHAEVVVAVRRPDDLVRAWHLFTQHPDQLGAFLGRGVADGVGDVDRRGAGLDGDLEDPPEVVVLGPGGVHRRPLHVVAEVAGVGDGLVDPLGHLVLVQRGDVAVQRRGADEGVDARASGVLHRLPAAVDVAVMGAGQAADDGVLGQAGDLADRLEIALGGDREARLDDVDAHLVEHLGDLQLLVQRHRGAGRLLAVAQGRVEDQDAVLARVGSIGHIGFLVAGFLGGRRGRGLL